LFPAEQARIIQLIVNRVDIGTDGVDITLLIDGFSSLIGELTDHSTPQRSAA